MSKGWTSRERVQAILDHTEPDRVPISLPMTVAAYKKLRQYLGFAPGKPILKTDYDEAIIDPDVARFLGVDLACIRLHSLPGKKPANESVFYDPWHIGRRLYESEPGIFFLETVESPLARAHFEDLKAFPWPDPHDPAWVEGLEKEAHDLFTGTELALVGRLGGSILDVARDLRGEDQWYEDLAENPDFACALLNRIASLQIELDGAGLAAAGKYLSIIEICEPEQVHGENRNFHFPKNILQQTIHPVLTRRLQAVRQGIKRYAARAKLMFSSTFPPFMHFQEMIEDGVNLFGALQPGFLDLNFAALKREYGKSLSFYGGVDEYNLLSPNNENDVRQNVKTCLEQLGAGGGFVLAPTRILQAGSLPQNIVAMCETVKVYGRY